MNWLTEEEERIWKWYKETEKELTPKEQKIFDKIVSDCTDKNGVVDWKQAKKLARKADKDGIR